MKKIFTLSVFLLAAIVVSAQMRYFRGQFAANKVVPPTSSSTAVGIAIATYNPATKMLKHYGNYRGLAGTITDAHIHDGTTGTNGPIVLALTNSGGTDGTLTGSIVLTAAQEVDLLAGNLYTDVHTSAFPDGEIRTQLTPTTADQTDFYAARLRGAEVVPATSSTATGTAYLLLDKATKFLYLTGSFSGLSAAASTSEIHDGAPNTNGPLMHSVINSTTPSGTLNTTKNNITDAQVASISGGNYYIEIHTSTYPSGEIRGQLTAGQLLPVNLAYFNGYKDRNTVALIWGSAQEINVKNYEVEQLNQETGEWIKKGTVAATGGSTSAKYRFDDMPAIGTKEYILYRLKMVDLQGTVTYSSIIRINYLQTKAALTLLANPVVNGTLGFTVSGLANNNQKAEISIVDFSGRILHKQSASTLLNNFVNVSKLSKGMYTLVVKTNSTVLQETFSRQ